LELTDDTLTRLLRVWMGNRGIWEALPGAGPTAPIPITDQEIERYVDAYAGFIAAVI
jgi:hypothetical protein